MIFLVWLVVGVICGFIGGSIAQGKGRDYFGWFVICALTGIFGIIIIAVLGPTQTVAAQAQLATTTAASTAADMKRWNTLVELDPEIAAAAAKARENGGRTEEFLAERYLTLNDKQYLQAALTKAIEANALAEANKTPALDDIKKQMDFEMHGTSGIFTTNGRRSDFKQKGDRFVILEGPGAGQSFATIDEMLLHFKPKV